MFPKPQSALVPNTYAYESGPMVKATGFREYDARWLFEKEINLMGVQALGMGLGALIARLMASRRSSRESPVASDKFIIVPKDVSVRARMYSRSSSLTL